MLTKKQHQLWVFIDDYQEQYGGASPSFEEMQQALGLKSKSGVHAHLMALSERGYCRRLENRARAIELLKHPAQRGDNVSGRHIFQQEMAKIPLYGEIAAGLPLEAFENTDQYIDVAVDVLPGGVQMQHRCFALKIVGDSMKGAGILDGDIVILERCDDASTGSVVAVLVDEQEVTLKIWQEEAGGRVSLVPANPDYVPYTYDVSRLQIQGRLVNLVRRYF